MNKSAEEGRTLDDAEQQEYDGGSSDVKAIDAHLKRLRDHEKSVIEKATVITPAATSTSEGAARVREGVITMGKSNLPKGTAFTRYAMALAASRGQRFEAIEIAKQWHDTTPEVELTLKGAIAAGDSVSSGWASQLVYAQNMAAEFIELLRPATIVGRINGLRRVPFNVRMPRATAGSSANWVGETHPKPLSKMTFDSVSLAYNKISCIVVLTEELVRMSNPSAEAIVRQDMLDAISQFTDQQFIDPTVAVSGVHSPASITNGATAHSFTGGTIAQITTDVSTMFADFSTANIDLTNGVFVMHPRSARYLSMLRTTQDVFAFPGITQNGGTFFGIPVITSNNVPIDTGADTYIVLMNASDILLADEGGIALDVSREASLQMADNPSDGAQSLVSLWQNNLVGLRAERFITWARRRSAAVSVLEDVSY
jgi:HK97 family phage major capsid protein